MKYKIIIILIFISLVSCVKKVDCLLPKKYELIKRQEIVSFPDKLIVYEINSSYIDYDKIQTYPKCSKVENYHYQKWINLEELDEKEKVHIILVVQEFFERIKKENKCSYDLENVFNNKKSLFFSGIYIKMKSARNRTYNFYERFNILHKDKKKLYQMEYIKNY